MYAKSAYCSFMPHTNMQVILNIKLQSTSGQSTISVIITIVGKTMDFLVTYGLKMPLEYVVMCYFSSSTAFINGFQVHFASEGVCACS